MAEVTLMALGISVCALMVIADKIDVETNIVIAKVMKKTNNFLFVTIILILRELLYLSYKVVSTRILQELSPTLADRFTSRLELAGTLIEYGFLNENRYFDRYGSAQAEWGSAKSVICGIRKEWNDPRFRENFEILATRGMKWMESHPPKIA